MNVRELRNQLENFPDYLEVKICRKDEHSDMIYRPLTHLTAVGGQFGATMLLLQESIK